MGTLAAKLVEALALLDVGDPPLLEVLDPGSGAVALKVGRLLRTDAGGGCWVLGGVEYVVRVEAGEVGIAGGPADGSFLASGDGGAAADSVGAGVTAGEREPAHDKWMILVVIEIWLPDLQFARLWFEGSFSAGGGAVGELFDRLSRSQW